MTRAKSVLLGLARLSVALLSVAAYGTTPAPTRPTTAAERAQFSQFAGPPIESFTYLKHYHAWTPLGHLQLVVWTTINDAYLLTVLPPCVGLDFATGIGVTNTARTVTRGVDAVTFDRQHCFISQIRYVDYLAMKRATKGLP